MKTSIPRKGSRIRDLLLALAMASTLALVGCCSGGACPSQMLGSATQGSCPNGACPRRLFGVMSGALPGA